MVYTIATPSAVLDTQYGNTGLPRKRKRELLSFRGKPFAEESLLLLAPSNKERGIPHPKTGFGMTEFLKVLRIARVISSDAARVSAHASSTIRRRRFRFPKGTRFRESSRIA